MHRHDRPANGVNLIRLELRNGSLGELLLIGAREIFEQVAEAIEAELLELPRAGRSDAVEKVDGLLERGGRCRDL